MIITIKHIISVCAMTSLLALSFIGCTQSTAPEVKYKVTFDENGHGTKPAAIEVLENTVLTAEQLKPLANVEGFVFAGWFDGETEAKAGTYKVNKDVTLKAKWKDIIAPAEVSNLQAVTGNTTVTLSWKEPTDADFAKVVITYGDKTVEVAKRTTTKDITGLENGKAYTFKIQTVDDKQNKSTGVTKDVSLYVLTETPIEVFTQTINNKPYDIVKFGDWPQSLKTADVKLSSNTTTVNGWTCFYGSDGAYYIKVTATPQANTYKFDDGSKVEEKEYYFKLEPIQWRVLTNNYNGKKLLFAEKALAAHKYHDTSNKYDTSDIRTYLNKDFINKAFTPAEIAKIPEIDVDNSAASTTDAGNNLTAATTYACGNTKDKIFLLSEKEITTADYGFDAYNKFVGDGNGTTTSTRIRKTTDYARATGAWVGSGDYVNNSAFWLRSPVNTPSYFARLVYCGGNAKGGDDVNYTFMGVVPALTISAK